MEIQVRTIKKVDRRYTGGNGTSCPVLGCKNSQKKIFQRESENCHRHKGKIRMFCRCKRPFRFHRMPKDDTELNQFKREKWVSSINRIGYELHKSSCVCSIHFKDGKPTPENPYPDQHMGYECEPSSCPQMAPNIDGTKVNEETVKTEMILGIGDQHITSQESPVHRKTIGRRIYFTDGERKAADAKRRRQKREIERRQLSLKKASESQTTLTLALANISKQVTRTVMPNSQYKSSSNEDVKPFFDYTKSMSIIIEPGREAEDVSSKCIPRVQIGQNGVTILETTPLALRNKMCGCVMCPYVPEDVRNEFNSKSLSSKREESRNEMAMYEQDDHGWTLDNVKIEITEGEDNQIEVMASDPLTLDDFNEAGLRFQLDVNQK